MKGYELTGQGVVPEEWIDINGHMNVAHYMSLFDKGTFCLLEHFSINQTSVAEGKPTVVASRVYVAHRKELCLGEQWQLWSGLVSIEAGSLTITHRLCSGVATHAVCDIMGQVISPLTRSKGVLSETQIEQAQRYKISGLKDRFVTL